jgi:hypothetical protein
MGQFEENFGDPFDDEIDAMRGQRDADSGNYEQGTRKCSECKVFKTTKDFNKEQSKKPAAKRICNDCGPPMPKDLNAFTVVQIKAQLKQGGEKDLTGKKADLVARLQALLDNVNAAPEEQAAPTETAPDVVLASTANAAPEEQAAPTESAPAVVLASTAKSTLTIKELKALKVADLKKELKARGLPVAGLKAVLQNRLADAEGLSLNPTVVNDSAKLAAKESPAKASPAQASPAKASPAKEIENKTSNVSCDNAQTGAGSPAAKPIIKKKAAKKVLKASSFALPPISNDKPATKAQVCIVLDKTNEKSNKVSFTLAPSDENAANGEIRWNRVAPEKGGSETKVVDNTNFYWCAKCRSWKDSHATSEHKQTPGKKKRFNNKKSRPLTPGRPGGNPMGVPLTPQAGVLTSRKMPTPAMNKKVLF